MSNESEHLLGYLALLRVISLPDVLGSIQCGSCHKPPSCYREYYAGRMLNLGSWSCLRCVESLPGGVAVPSSNGLSSELVSGLREVTTSVVSRCNGGVVSSLPRRYPKYYQSAGSAQVPRSKKKRGLRRRGNREGSPFDVAQGELWASLLTDRKIFFEKAYERTLRARARRMKCARGHAPRAASAFKHAKKDSASQLHKCDKVPTRRVKGVHPTSSHAAAIALWEFEGDACSSEYAEARDSGA